MQCGVCQLQRPLSMDSASWQAHLIVCSRLAVDRAKAVTAAKMACTSRHQFRTRLRVRCSSAQPDEHLMVTEYDKLTKDLDMEQHSGGEGGTIRPPLYTPSSPADAHQLRDDVRSSVHREESQLHSLPLSVIRDSLLAGVRENDRMVVNVGGRESERMGEYEKLTRQCEWLNHEMDLLNQRHFEMLRRREQAERERDDLRHKYDLAKREVSQFVNELHNVEMTNKQLLSRLQQSEQELADQRKVANELKADNVELRRQQQELLIRGEQGSAGAAFEKLYYSLVKKFEALQQDYDDLKKQATSTANSDRSRLEQMEHDMDRAKLECREANRAQEKAQTELTRMQQHYGTLVVSMREEKTKMEIDLERLRTECDSLTQRVSQLLVEHSRSSKEIHQLKGERDAAVHEYQLVMSERDEVHKDVDSLEKRVSDLMQQLDKADKSKQQLNAELEVTKRDNLQLQERMKCIRKFGDINSTEDRWREEVDDCQGFQAGSRNNSSRGFQSHQPTFERQKPTRDSLDSKAVETFRKDVEKLQRELVESRQEVLDAQKCRDWAFSERDKIISENRNLHEQTDKLRLERDIAVSKLADALRDCDEWKRQKSDANREAKELKEKYENLVDRETRKERLNSIGHNHSHDSAIDTDLQDWETETLDVEIDEMDLVNPGFELAGTTDNAIYVSNVMETSSVFGKLRTNDQVIRINNVDILTNDGNSVLQCLRGIHKPVRMVVKRRKPVARTLLTVHFNNTSNRDVGIVVEQGVFISRIVPGSLAAKDNMVAVGDRIMNINGRVVDGLSISEVAMLLQQSDHIAVSLRKYNSYSPGSIAPSSSSSGHNLTDYLPESLSVSPNSVRTADLSSSGPVLRSSSSQTDCVADSPIPSEKSSKRESSEKRTLLGRAMHKIIHPFRSLERTERNSRDERCRSAVENIFAAAKDKSAQEDAALEELDNVIDQFVSPNERKAIMLDLSNSGAASNTSRDNCGTWITASNASRDSCGTWPRCRPNMVTGNQSFNEPASQVNVVQHSLALTQPLHLADSSSGSGTLKRSVQSCDRNESFKRSASFKHSPQNSDSSTVKMSPYASMRHSPETSISKTYISPSNIASTPTSFLSNMSSKSKGFPSLEQILEKPDDVHVCQTIASHTGTIERRPTPSPDYNITSGSKQDDLFYHTPRKPAGRPLSAMPTFMVPQETYGLPLEKKSSLFSMSLDSAQGPSSFDRNQGTSSFDRSQGSTSFDRNQGSSSFDRVQGPSSFDKQMSAVRPLNIVQKPTSLDLHSVNAPHSLETSYRLKQVVSPTAHIVPLTRPPPAQQNSNRMGEKLPHQRTIGYVRPSPSTDNSSLLAYRSSNVQVHGGSGPITSLAISPPAVLSYSTSSTIPALPPPATENRIPLPFRLQQHVQAIEGNKTGPPLSPSLRSHSQDGQDQSFSSVDEFPYYRFQSRSNPREVLTSNAYTICRHMPYIPQNQDRYRIASNQSMQSSSKSSGGRLSNSSFDKMSDRGSPMSPFLPGPPLGDLRHSSDSNGCSGSSVASDQLTTRKRHRLKAGELRRIQRKKSTEQLGINITSRDVGSGGGVFVSSVSENSLAANAGIEVGDQLLEVNGINLRKASYDHAASVLRSCGSSIDMLVQYNPEEDHMIETVNNEDEEFDDSDVGDLMISSPRKMCHHHSNETLTPEILQTISTANNAAGPPQGLKTMDNEMCVNCEARLVIVKKTHAHESLGVQVIGGNATGLFVHFLQPSSAANNGAKGLRRGDQILEFNGVNFRNVTAEQAYLEMCKPAESVTLWAQYNITKYSLALDQPCDALYVRALFDRQAENEGELTFHKDDILFIDNTMCNGRPGSWHAFIVDDEGNRHKSGTVPSKTRIEDELLRKRSMPELVDEDLKSSHRNSLTARRSFFKRRRHQRNSSKDSRDFIHSDISINGDSVGIHEDGSCSTYERVERLDNSLCRPVILVGALADAVINKLVSESPDKYLHIDFEMMKISRSSLEINDGVFVDFHDRADGYFDCITVQSVKDGMEKSRHCLLNVQPTACDTLRKVQIFPITIFIKHKNAKQIKDTKDARFLPDKLNSKVAKELFEMFKDYEMKYKRYFADTVSGDNLAMLATRVKYSIDHEQKRTIWFPSGNL